MFSAFDSFLKCGRTVGGTESDNVCELLCAAAAGVLSSSTLSIALKKREEKFSPLENSLLKFELDCCRRPHSKLRFPWPSRVSFEFPKAHTSVQSRAELCNLF